LITLDSLKASLPRNRRGTVTQETVNNINGITSEEGEEFSEAYRDNFISYTKVLASGEYKLSDYISAVKFVSFKLMEESNIDAYMKTFPERYGRLLSKYREFGTLEEIRDKKISAYATMYNKNKLVYHISDQSTIPNHVLNAPMYQQALNVQAHLMVNSRSDMVKMQAANSILTHLKPPETIKMELDIGLKENDAIADLRKVTQELAAQQRLAISSGIVSSKEIAESVIIEAVLDE